MENYTYTNEDLARMCEVAVILSQFKTDREDLHDFHSKHVKPLFDAWLLGKGKGVYSYLNEDEKTYITEFANRVAKKLYS